MELLRPEISGNNNSLQLVSKNRQQPWVVRLSRHDLADKITRVKSKFTAFNTKEIDVSSHNQETCNSLIQSSIFINELLNGECFSRFNNLKRIANGLGFKYLFITRIKYNKLQFGFIIHSLNYRSSPADENIFLFETNLKLVLIWLVNNFYRRIGKMLLIKYSKAYLA